MRTILVCTAFVFALFLSGCSTVVSMRPLSTLDDLKNPILDPRLTGEWILSDTFESDSGGKPAGPPIRAKIIGPAGPYGSYSVEFRKTADSPGKGEEIYDYTFRLVSLNGDLYYDAELSRVKRDQIEFKYEDMNLLLAAPAHLLGRVWVEPDFVRFASWDSEWVKKHVLEDSWESVSVEKYSDVITLLNSTAELRKLVTSKADSEGPFAPWVYLCRPGADCQARATEDRLLRAPNDVDTLEDAVTFFLQRKRYDRALALQQHVVELKPGDAAKLERLGEVQMFNRDFAGARHSFTVAMQSPPPPAWLPESPAGRLIAWCYFLEGAYADALAASANYELNAKTPSAEPILLSYSSLIRLGRRAEAETFLREKSASYKGPLADQALPLSALGRCADCGYPMSPKNEEGRRTVFFAMLNQINRGDKANARRTIANTADKAPNDSLMALATQIELERLGNETKK